MTLKELRLRVGLSQSQLSKASGINLRTLQSYEINARAINRTSLYTLTALCKALNCKLNELITDSELINDIGNIM